MKNKFFIIAKHAALHSTHLDHPMGATIVYKNKLISSGYNKTHTHPKSPCYGIHAEVDAILRSRCDLKGCDIYVYRETKSGVPSMAKPCVACMGMLIEKGIKRVYYTDNNEQGWSFVATKNPGTCKKYA